MKYHEVQFSLMIVFFLIRLLTFCLNLVQEAQSIVLLTYLIKNGHGLNGKFS